MSAHHAVIADGRVTAGSTVGIIGFGGLGQIGSRVAVLAGADVYVAEINARVWQQALAAGSRASSGASRSSRGSPST
jgi:alcohol dehydrogenase, propanol-preferring